MLSIGLERVILNVLSLFYNAIDSGTGKPGAVTRLPGADPPEGDSTPAKEPQGVA